MNVLRIVMSGTCRAPGGDALQGVGGGRRTLHELQDALRGVLERNVEVGQDAPSGHQLDDLVDVRIGIDIMQPDPHAELAERGGQILKCARRSSPRHSCAAYLKSDP